MVLIRSGWVPRTADQRYTVGAANVGSNWGASMPCQFCGAPNTIERSHVVSDFLVRYLRENSVRRALFHTWHRRAFARFMIVGPYLCQHCDNVVFSGWEDAFSRDVFAHPLAATYEWGRETTLRFIFSIGFRYAVHSLVVDPNPAHQAIGVLFRDLCRAALNDPTCVGQAVFVYPFVYQPITATCALRPGINHFLTLGFNDRFLMAGGGLPNRYFIQLPGLSFLFSEVDLTTTGVPGYADLIDLRVHTVFVADTSNTRILDLYTGLLNEGVQLTMNDQTARNLWRAFLDAVDQRRNPHRMVYRTRVADQALLDWQRANCAPHF